MGNLKTQFTSTAQFSNGLGSHKKYYTVNVQFQDIILSDFPLIAFLRVMCSLISPFTPVLLYVFKVSVMTKLENAFKTNSLQIF